MSKKRETVFKERLQKRLKKIPNSWFMKVEAGAIHGIPDIIGVVNGFFIAMELKKDKATKPDKLQQYTLDIIRSVAKGISFKVDPSNMLSVLNELNWLSKKKRKLPN